jgi:hypothetical protein
VWGAGVYGSGEARGKVIAAAEGAVPLDIDLGRSPFCPEVSLAFILEDEIARAAMMIASMYPRSQESVNAYTTFLRTVGENVSFHRFAPRASASRRSRFR